MEGRVLIKGKILEQAATADSDEATNDGVSQNGVAKLSVQTWESGILR